mgnify:CR=1 FL=1
MAKIRLLHFIGAVGLTAVVAGMPVAKAEDALTPAQRAAVEQTIHDYLLKHPELILEAVQGLEAQQKQAEEAKTREVIAAHRRALQDDPNSVVLGDPHGDVTIVEFFDYRCPYCKQVEPQLEALLKEDPKVRLVLKEFPILGPDSLLASRAAIAARAQGKYQAMHDALMQARGKFDEPVITQIAKEVGLDAEKLKTDMADPKVDATIRTNHALAEALGINGTPGFIVGDALVPGATDLEKFRLLVKEARSGCVSC